MGIEERVKKPMGKVSITIEQEKDSCDKQRGCLSFFAMDLAKSLFGKNDRDPIPQPRSLGSGEKKYYSIGFGGTTQLSLSDVNKLLEEYALQKPYTQIMLHGDGLSVKYVPKSAKSQSL